MLNLRLEGLCYQDHRVAESPDRYRFSSHSGAFFGSTGRGEGWRCCRPGKPRHAAHDAQLSRLYHNAVQSMATGLMTRPGAAPALALPCRRDAERVNAARSCSRSPVRAQFGSVSSFNWWRNGGHVSRDCLGLHSRPPKNRTSRTNDER